MFLSRVLFLAVNGATKISSDVNHWLYDAQVAQIPLHTRWASLCGLDVFMFGPKGRSWQQTVVTGNGLSRGVFVRLYVVRF